MNPQPAEWFEVRLEVPPELVEAVEFAFNELDSVGNSVDLVPADGSETCSVAGYFTKPLAPEVLSAAIKTAMEIHGHSDVGEFQVQQCVVEEQDWLAEWKKYWTPVKIGRFIVAAPWFDVASASEIVVRIDPGMAFGTGTHETTRLCLAAIDEFYLPGRSFLDVGTGTGVLAIAAAKMSAGSPRIVAIDNDGEAIAIARSNAQLNGVLDSIEFVHGTVDQVKGTFDFVCANLTADVIIPALPTLLERTENRLVMSGILAEQERSVRQSIPGQIEPLVQKKGEWIAMHLCKDTQG